MKWLLLFGTATLFALSAFAAGVAVGNGQSTYLSPTGFSVAYDKSLTLMIGNSATFKISNERLVKSAEPTSQVSFDVAKADKTTVEDLSSQLNHDYPKLSFQSIVLPGAKGFFWEAKDQKSTRGLYFLLTSNFTLVKVTLKAFAAGEGLALVAPIVRSFTYDNTPPEVTELRVDMSTWTAGSQQRLYFRATDDNSGVDLASVQGIVAVHNNSLQSGFDGGQAFYTQKGARDEGSGWYSLAVDVNRYQAPGTYSLEVIDLADHAGNQAHYVHYSPLAHYTEFNLGLGPDGSHETALVPAQVTIVNSGVSDKTAPVLQEIRADSSVWLAGESHRVYMRITDDVSGVDLSGFSCDGLRTTADRGDYAAFSEQCKNPRAEGGDWYSIELTSGRYLPDGTYSLPEIYLNDLAGNRAVFVNEPFSANSKFYTAEVSNVNAAGDTQLVDTKIPMFTIRLKNPGQAEVDPAHIPALRTDTLVWHAGQKQRLHFQVTGDVAGLQLGSAASLLTTAEIASFTREGTGSELSLHPENIVAEGGDWYYADVTVSPFQQGGTYDLMFVFLYDRAGIISGVSCVGDDYTTALSVCHDDYGTKIPALKIQVVR